MGSRLSQYTKTMEKLTTELKGLIEDVPGDMHLGKYLIDEPIKGKRLVWLLIATGEAVADRVLFHFGWDHPQQIRDEAWGTGYWPDKMIRGDRLFELWLEKQ